MLLLFSAATVILAAQSVAPARLVLDKRGFAYSWLGRGWRRRWDDVERFELYNPSTGLRHERRVGYFLAARPDGVMDKVNRGLGADRFIPGGWSIPPNQLLELMKQYHAAYAERGDQDRL